MSIPATTIRTAGPAGFAAPSRGQRAAAASGFSRQLSEAVSTLGRGAGAPDLRSANSSEARGRGSVGADSSSPAAATPIAQQASRGPEPATTPGNPFAGRTPPLSAAEVAKQAEPKSTAWCPWEGPCDSRDAIPFGGGQLTASGAPRIVENAAATRNQYNYAGPASKNPYFTSPGNPLREGYVAGFGSWFLGSPAILGPNQKTTAANPTYFATEEGAKEALRLVQQYEPGAQMTSRTWGGGPFVSNQPMYFITLPNGKELNAGGIIEGYYNRGFGVTISSDAELERSVRLA